MEVAKRILKRIISSKRVWALAAGLITPLLNEWLGLGLSEAEVVAMIGAIIAAIVGDSVRPIDPEKAGEDEEIRETIRERIKNRLGRG